MLHTWCSKLLDWVLVNESLADLPLAIAVDAKVGWRRLLGPGAEDPPNRMTWRIDPLKIDLGPHLTRFQQELQCVALLTAEEVEPARDPALGAFGWLRAHI